MKKSLIALAVLAASGAAMAQSSVTLFGIVDAGYAVGKGSLSNKTQLRNSGYNSSRLGFRGVEDLGGGMKAGFHLEAGVGNDDGSGAGTSNNNQSLPAWNSADGKNSAINPRNQGLTFNRRSTVSLEGSMGELRLGRDYTPQFWSETAFDPFGTNGVGTNIAFNSGGNTGVRASNSIGWLSPSISGFKIWAQTYMGENASTAAQNGDGNGIRFTYDQGALSLAYATSTVDTSASTAASTSNKTSNMAASYDLGVAKLMVMSNLTKNTGASDTKGSVIGALVPMAGGTFRISMSDRKTGAVEAKQTALGFVKPLSKRTDLYTTYARLANSGGSAVALNGSTTAANASSTGYEFGVKHAF